MYIYHAVLNFKGLENAAEDMLLYCKFRKRKSKHNIEDIIYLIVHSTPNILIVVDISMRQTL